MIHLKKKIEIFANNLIILQVYHKIQIIFNDNTYFNVIFKGKEILLVILFIYGYKNKIMFNIKVSFKIYHY
jgi:hypothetical protein